MRRNSLDYAQLSLRNKYAKGCNLLCTKLSCPST